MPDQERERLRELVIAGLESGEGRSLTDDLVAELRREALGSAG
jgi:Arc/MetJ-type ribon-helix-helix transcriptional regulator